MSSVIGGFVLFVLAMLGQWWWNSHFSYWGAAPQFLFALTILIAARRGPIAGMLAGFAWGIYLDVARADNRAVVRTRHNTRFNAARVGKELAQLAQRFACFKAIGDAMARTEMAASDVSNFFKACLDIPFDAKSADVSTRKLNQFQGLNNAYRETVREGTAQGSVWTALNAITRYVDHDRSTRGGNDESRLVSSQFGSGEAMKGKAMELLLPLVKDRVAVAA